MHYKAVTIATLLFASVAVAQTQDRVFDFANKPTAQGLQEVATILRTVGDVQFLSIDSAASTIKVTGNPDQLGMVAWMIRELDQPAQPATTPVDQYLVPAGAAPRRPTDDDVIRVFFLKHITTQQQVQEILTVLRTVADVQKVFNYSAPAALVVRGPAAQNALAEYLINALDVAPTSLASSQEFNYQPTGRPTMPSSVVRVFYLANSSTPQQMQEMLTVLRTVADIQKVFNYSGVKALAIRSSAADMAVSEWIIKTLDIPATEKPGPKAAVLEFTIPQNLPNGNIVRVFFPPHISTQQAMQQTLTALRTKLQIQKVFSYTALMGIVMRGTGDQIAKAEQLILEQDQLASAAH